MLNKDSNTFKNDMYYFLKTAVITFYGKCLENFDNSYYQSFLKAGENVYDYTGFLDELYKNYYKEIEKDVSNRL
nr:hypothetical protein RKQZWNHN_RKQZWNHN_CDS_0010 [Microvirus sp.]